jgi:Xaa-Pro dipeptidase
MENAPRGDRMQDVDRRTLLRGAALGGAGLAAGLAGCRASADAPDAAPEIAPAASGPPRTGAAADVRALFAHLADQRGSVAPISPAERRARRERLARVLAEQGLDALLVEPGATMSWLTGVSWGRSERLFAFLGTADGDHRWIVPAFEEGKARLAWDEHDRPEAVIAQHLGERRLERVAIEPQLRFTFADRLAQRIGRYRVVSGQPVVFALRARKDEHEIAILRRANELTQLAIREVAATLRPGLTGADVAARMAAAHERLGLRGSWALCLVDAAAALPHGEDHDLALGKDSHLLVDTGASLHGYQSDITRTWATFGAPSAEVERAWYAVRDAQQRAFELVAPGVLARDVDACARAALVANGYPGGYQSLTHRLGHGIGMEGHEDPYFDGGSDVTLASGMTLSDEPGIYVVGRFGVRIEDIVVVTESGCDHFGAWQSSPRSPA